MAISCRPPETILKPLIYIAGPWDCWTRDNEGYGGLTLRQVISACLVLRDASKLKFLPGYLNTTYTIGKCYIGHKPYTGDFWDFDGNQVQVKWDGNDGVVVYKDGLYSDPVDIAITKGQALIVAMYFTGISSIPNSENLYMSNGWYKAGDDAATTDATGYSEAGYAGSLNVIQAVEPV